MRSFYSFTFLLSLLACIACKPNSAPDSNAAGTPGHGKEYKIDVARSELKWEASKPLGTHHGIVPVLDGTVTVDGDLISGGTVKLDMKNLRVTDLEGEDKQNLEEHLKGNKPGKEDDFFNTSKYPTATFVIKGSSKINDDPEATHLVQGELTMRDITKPVNIKAKVDMAAGNAIKITSAPFAIDRTEWGIKFRSKKFFDDLKDDFVNDEIKIELTVGAVR